MVTVQISIPEREWQGFDKRIKEIKRYYEERQDREFGERSFIRVTLAGQRTIHKRKEISDAFVIRQAVLHFHGEIHRIQEEEKKQKDTDEIQNNNVSETTSKTERRWWMKSKQ